MALAGILSKETAVIAVPIVTLLLGLLIGWLGQRSGFCSIGGFRDFIMFRHTRLLYGFLALILGAFIGFLIFKIVFPPAFEGFFWLISKGLAPVSGAPAGLTITGYIILALVGGIAVGLIGVLLGGCPLRQLVMTAEGNVKSFCFVIGMCIGSVVFTLWVSGLAVSILKSLGMGA
ncbi:MAG: YeeE/YedE family protein [Methanomicrobiales archaeon]|nr:YeeE/YedE family protein [Methanomicrobiales archaeon]